jgi:DNA-binding MarR family transcriptional regulator
VTSSLDLFIMALIDQGAATAYALSRAGISLGAALPALKRLAKDGLVKKGKPGARRSTAHELTARGRDALGSWRDMWQRYLDQPPNDIESLCRVAALAWSGGRRRDALRLLESAAAKAETTTLPQSMAARPAAASSLGATYAWMGSVTEAARKQAERRALARIIKALRQCLKS